MSIETLLTLIVAAGLLLGAALLRLAAIGIYRMSGWLWGRYGPAAEPARGHLDDALPGPSLRQRTDRVLDGLGALLIYAVASTARGLQIVYEAMRFAVRAAWYLAVATYAWLAPRVEASYRTIRRDGIVAYRWTVRRLAAMRRARRTPLPVTPLIADTSTIPALARAKTDLGRHAGAA